MGRTRLLLKQLKLEMLKKTLLVVYLLQIKAKILFLTKIQEYSKTCVKRPLSNRQKIGFQDQISLNAGQKYHRILLTFIKLPFVTKTFVLSIFGWPFYTGLTVD